jgi:anti-sigma28 factor (negative regulator of flagellin synthesis)
MRPPKKQAQSLEELRARIQLGRYDVKPDRVAEAMLRRGVSFSLPRSERRD